MVSQKHQLLRQLSHNSLVTGHRSGELGESFDQFLYCLQTIVVVGDLSRPGFGHLSRPALASGTLRKAIRERGAVLGFRLGRSSYIRSCTPGDVPVKVLGGASFTLPIVSKR